MRWLRPPPAATAAFSSARSPGVVLRVSRMRAPVPATASTKRAVRVAMPERWPRKLSAVRSATSSAAAGPLASSTSAGTPSRHWPSTTSLSTCSTPHWRIVSSTRSKPKATPGLFLHDPRPGPGIGSAPSPRWSRRRRRRPPPAPGRRSPSATRRARPSRHPRSTARRAFAIPCVANARLAISRSTRPQRLIHEVTELPPFQTLIDEHAGDVMAVCRGAVGRERRRRLLPGDLHRRPARLPEAERRRQPARLADHDRAPQGDRPPPRQGPAAAAGRRGAGGRGRGPAARRRRSGSWSGRCRRSSGPR